MPGQHWDGSVTTFGYNANRQIASVTDPGGQVSLFGYDSDNRLADIRDGLASDYVAAWRFGRHGRRLPDGDHRHLRDAG